MDRSGSAVRTADSAQAGTRESEISGRGACAGDALPKGGEASTQRCRRCFGSGKFCRHHDVHRWQLMLRKSEGFSHQATQAIAGHGISRGFYRDRQTNPWMAEIVARDAHTKEAIV